MRPGHNFFECRISADQGLVAADEGTIARVPIRELASSVPGLAACKACSKYSSELKVRCTALGENTGCSDGIGAKSNPHESPT